MKVNKTSTDRKMKYTDPSAIKRKLLDTIVILIKQFSTPRKKREGGKENRRVFFFS